MNHEIRDAIGDLGQAFEAFKEANDRRIREIESKGAADPVTDAKVNRLNQEVARTQEIVEFSRKRIEGLETTIKRSPLGENKNDEFAEAINFMRARKGLTDPASVDVDSYRAYKSALRGYLRKNNAGSGPDEIKALSVGSDPDGGYWVTSDMSGRIATLVHEASPLRRVANIVTIGTDALEGTNDLDEATIGWVGETAARSETATPSIGEWRIPVHEQYAEPRVTQKLLDDAQFDIEEWLAVKIADKFARMENTAFVTGNGNKKPRGFLTYAHGVPSASAWDVIEQVPSGGSGAFAATSPGDALINLVFKLKANYRENAAFMMKRSTMAEVRKLKDGQGNYLWQPDFIARQGGTLLGYPVLEAEDMPAIAADSLSVAFGDFRSGYQIVDRQGVRILRDAFTAKPFVKFYTTKRVGGDVTNFEAIKLMKFATSV